MTIYDNTFPLGVGTNRFPVKGANDEDGIEQAANLVAQALNAGASYIDVADTYSKGAAEEICKRAFQKTNAPRHVTVKSSFLSDKTADDALRRIENSLTHMGIDHASYFVCWNISSYEQFLEIMKKGSLYEGAVLAKQRGLIDHICFSSHAPPRDIIKILESKVFEGVTISFSALNAQIMLPVLDCAEQNHIGVVAMNPLGGGVIPQQSGYFSFLCNREDRSAAMAALRYVQAHTAVKVLLSGMSCSKELSENLAAFQTKDLEKPQERVARINSHFQSMEGFCTGCHYCDGCPKGINIFELMQAYNTTLFPQPEELYGRTDGHLIENMGICSRLKNTFGFLPPSSKNPCIGCGECEKKCTMHLPISKRIEELCRRFADSGFSKDIMLERLRQLIGNRRKIGFYPGGGYTAYVLTLLKEAFPATAFEIFVFDSNPAMWGKILDGHIVQAPRDILTTHPDIVIISNYNYSDEIYQSLMERLRGKIPVEKLHKQNDVPWVF